MKNIREQLLDLGFNGKDLNQPQDILRFLTTDLKDQFLSLIMNRDQLGKFYEEARYHNLDFRKRVRRDLHAIYETAMRSQFLDALEVERYFQSLVIKHTKGQGKRKRISIDKNVKGKSARNNTPRKRLSKQPLRMDSITASEKAEAMREAAQIGLGIESSLKLPRVRRDAVVIDIHTKGDSNYEKSILYAAGHSLKHEPED